MALQTSSFVTLADLASQLDPDGKPATVIDLLSQSNPVVQNMLWTEGNLPTGHKITQRTSLPQGTWRAMNQPVGSQKSTTTQIIESCGLLEGVSDIDVMLADLGGNADSVRLNEDMAFAEGLTQQFATTLFYGDESVIPNSFNGLSKRYGSLSTTYGQQANNVIDMGGQNAVNTSIWIVSWGMNCTTGIFPRGTVGGLNHRDMGEVIKYDGSGNSLRVYQSRWDWQCGIAVADWRYNVRLANIDSTLVGVGTSSPDLGLAMMAGLAKLPTVYGAASYNTDPTRPSGMVGGGRTEIYMNRTVASALTQQSSYRRNMFLMQDQYDGKPRLTFQGVPIRITDALLNTEARVTSAQPT